MGDEVAIEFDIAYVATVKAMQKNYLQVLM